MVEEAGAFGVEVDEVIPLDSEHVKKDVEGLPVVPRAPLHEGETKLYLAENTKDGVDAVDAVDGLLER